MKKILVISTFALMMGISNNALAQYTGPSVATMTVAEASNLRDDTPVVLTGVIEKSLGGEKYLFSDATGQVTVEIDDEDWRGLTVNEIDTVEIKGEVDKEFTSFIIDVDSITKK